MIFPTNGQCPSKGVLLLLSRQEEHRQCIPQHLRHDHSAFVYMQEQSKVLGRDQ